VNGVVSDALAIEVRVCAPEAIGAAWQRLWSRVPGATPFASPAWLMPWARHYAPDRCWVALAAHGDELVGCLPVFWWQGGLLLAGTGPSDHGGALLLPGFESCAQALLAAALRAIERTIERIEFQQLRAGSALLEMASPRGWRDAVETGVVCPVLALAGTDGTAQIPKRMQRNWRYSLHAIARHEGRVERVPDDEAGDALAELARLHALRWAGRGEAGVLADPLLCRLLADAGPALAEAGLLRLQRLVVGARTVAVLFAMHGDRQTCCYLSGFDPAFAKLSPVTALVGATIAQAAREGDRAVDFLRGEEPYKYGWGAAAEARFRRVFVPA
jgi:CelD/BcsL family acetyltransferase involved in cellulose biosynthesis